MNNQELFELRKKKLLTFPNPIDLTAFLDNLFIKEVKLPLVIGYQNFDHRKNQKVVHLKPKEVSDELTVRNYREGLRRFADFWKKDKDAESFLTPNFQSILIYEGIDAGDRRYQDNQILGIHIGFTNNSRNRSLGGYNLDLFNQGPNYIARTKEDASELERIMKSYLGPN